MNNKAKHGKLENRFEVNLNGNVLYYCKVYGNTAS